MKRDNEKTLWILVLTAFAGAVLAIDLFVAKWSSMGAIILIISIALNIASGISAVLAFKHFDNPNKDWIRKLTVALLVLTIVVIMGHHAGYIEHSMFEQGVK